MLNKSARLQMQYINAHQLVVYRPREPYDSRVYPLCRISRASRERIARLAQTFPILEIDHDFITWSAGARVQYMTADILQQWLAALDIPRLTDVFQTATQNYFYVSFARDLSPADIHKIASVGFAVERTPPLRSRYSLVWSEDGRQP